MRKAGIEPSVGSIGDSYEKALAERVIGLFKTKIIHARGPGCGHEDVEFATLGWVSWYNTQRLLEPIGYVPPVEFELNYHRNQQTHVEVAGSMKTGSGKAGAVHDHLDGVFNRDTPP